MHSAFNITIENNDCKIWHKDDVILNLLQAIQQNRNVTIKLNAEGPCAESLGLYQLLDKICNQYNYDKNRIVIHTCNLLERSSVYRIVKVAPTKHISSLQKMAANGALPTKTVASDIKHFGHFIGHSSRARLAIAAWLFKHHKDKSFQTFHTVPTNELHREFVGLEDLWMNNYGAQHVDNAVEFLKQTPLTFDRTDARPILDMAMYGILDAYPKIFVEIVNNTYITGNTFYLDEKLWRPIITKTPFIVHGPRNFIKNLRLLGFKTFDQWWDEGYSEDQPDYQVNEIIKNIDQLASLSADQLADIYADMQPVLDHNYEVFLSLTSHSFFKEYQ